MCLKESTEGRVCGLFRVWFINSKWDWWYLVDYYREFHGLCRFGENRKLKCLGLFEKRVCQHLLHVCVLYNVFQPDCNQSRKSNAVPILFKLNHAVCNTKMIKEHLQGDQSGCAKTSVDILTKVPF